MEHRGFEPLTSTLRTLRATNCANAPYSLRAGDTAASTDNRYNSTTACKLQALFLLFSSDVMTALLPSEIPMNRLTISGLFAPQPPPQFFSNFFLHSVYRREGSIANTHAEWVIMVWRKAAVSARKAEDHAERRRPVNQPRGRNRRESASFDSARRRGLLLPKSYPLARKAVVEKKDLLNIPLILHRRIGLQQEIAHWAQIEIDHLPEPLNPLLCFRPLSPSPEIRHALVWKRYDVFTKAADAFLRTAKSLHESDRMPLDSPV